MPGVYWFWYWERIVIERNECGRSSAQPSFVSSSSECQSMITSRSSATCQIKKSVSPRDPIVE